MGSLGYSGLLFWAAWLSKQAVSPFMGLVSLQGLGRRKSGARGEDGLHRCTADCKLAAPRCITGHNKENVSSMCQTPVPSSTNAYHCCFSRASEECPARIHQPQGSKKTPPYDRSLPAEDPKQGFFKTTWKGNFTVHTFSVSEIDEQTGSTKCFRCMCL